MSDTDNTKEIPAQQVSDQLTPWRIESDHDGTGEFLVIAGDGQIVAVLIPIAGDVVDGADTQARALCLAKAPEMQQLLRRAIAVTDDGFNVHKWLAEVKALLARTT